MELKGKKINFLGDSITEGHGTSSISKRYSSLIEEREGAICRNYGISGTRIARQKKPSENQRHDLYFCSRVQEMEKDTDIMVVFGGTNDFGHGDAPIGSFTDRTVDTFYGACHTLYTSLIEKYPLADIVIITPLHRCNEDNLRGDGDKDTDVGSLKTYVEIIREVAEYYSLPVLDLFATSGIQPKLEVQKQLLMPDGLHPNDAGHEILYKKITSFLKSL